MSQQIDFLNSSSIETHFITHHTAHASSFFFSPFDEAAILTVDAFGEKQCATFFAGSGKTLTPVWDQEFPHSLGAFYSTFTEYCGFQPQSDEWKLMGASAYGDPDRLFSKVRSLVDLRASGAFALDLEYFNHYQFHRPGYFSARMTDLLGFPPNPLDHPLEDRYYDLSAAAQRVMEDIYFHLLNALHEKTKCRAVVIAGGTALNSLANGKIFERTPFREAFVPPVPDDSGGSLGAACYAHCVIRGRDRSYVMRNNYLGPGYGDDEIRSSLEKYQIPHRELADPAMSAAEQIAQGKIVGWFQGRLEFGDRALGNRSILADPRDASMKDKINACIKYREAFRPFAPAILSEYADEFFVNAHSAPFMERVFTIRPDKRAAVPAVTHEDGTGRLQTVTRDQNEIFHRLIAHFHSLTGVPLVVNTSFNLKGEAIVCSPEDAIRTFFTSGLDSLFLGPFLIEKHAQEER